MTSTNECPPLEATIFFTVYWFDPLKSKTYTSLPDLHIILGIIPLQSIDEDSATCVEVVHPPEPIALSVYGFTK